MHEVELYLEHALPRGLTDLKAWSGRDEDILPLIQWEWLWHVPLARICLRDRWHPEADHILSKLRRLEELSRAYAAWCLLRLHRQDIDDQVDCLLQQDRVRQCDIAIIDGFFAQPLAAAA